jgi:hypothetical protein
MPRLLDYLSPFYAWLAAINPDLPRALFVMLVFSTVWLIRQYAPNKWEQFANLVGVKSDDTSWLFNELRAAWQMLPAAIIGTIYGVLGTGGDVVESLRLAALALLAPVVHRIAQRYQGRLPEKPARANSVRVGMTMALACILLLPSCAAWKDAKPVLRTVDDIARSLCGQFFGEKQGISVEEAARKFCQYRDDYAPWIDGALALKQSGGKAALARKPAE